MRRFGVIVILSGLAVSVLHAGAWPGQTPATSQAAAGFPAVGAPPIVTLIAAGAEPRTPLRYRIAAGTRSRTEISTSLGMVMEMPGMPMAMPEMQMPTIKMVLEAAITEVAANGDMSFTTSLSSMTFDTSSGDPAIVAAMQGVTPPDLTSMKVTGIMTSRGFANNSLDLTKIADPQLKQIMESASSSLDSLASPFPEEAVGVGARWELRRRALSGGLDMLSKTTVEIVAMQGNKITLKQTMEQTAPPQALKNPALPPDAEVRLLDFKGTGTTTATADLSQLSTEGSGTAKMTMTMQVKVQGMEQNMSTTTNMKLTFTPVK